ncbi:MAG: undecaprenyldiphospho-muramoylpentapeptide beta-N-acetylglucosaminyltransferase [Candidatus Ancaeobacter aquaticus]|nr:undecaprenyldiphospho-muramoylpentapeptide beta-N-acetylglucosaminyltransferase [Candidatus Ancaeobacter aquaticus]
MRLLIAAGGSGGHILPGISVAQACSKRWSQVEILFICSKREIEKRIYQGKQFSYRKIGARPISAGVFGKCIFMWAFVISFFEALGIILSFKPDIILGMGGYVSAPVVVAGWVLRKQMILHEQNSVPGKANRFSARFVDTVMIGIKSAKNHFTHNDLRYTGNPVRDTLLKADPDDACVKFGLEKGVFTILVVGGSQGAEGLNRIVLDALEQMHKKKINFQVIHMAGRTCQEVKTRYKELCINAYCETYFDDIGLAYAASDVVVSRAGASAITEITLCRKPSILIPYPYSTDAHQEQNALHLVNADAAIMVKENDHAATQCVDILCDLYTHPDKREMYAKNCESLAEYDADKKIAETIHVIYAEKRKNVKYA